MHRSPKMRILVALCTSGRDLGMLLRCLESIAKAEPPVGSTVDVCLTVNMEAIPERLAMEVSDLAGRTGLKVFVVTECRLGIPFARNSGLRYAIEGGYTHIAFIDDDAYADPLWLVRLAEKASSRYCAVGGPQIGVLSSEKKGIAAARLYGGRVLSDGDETWWTATNNALASVEDIKAAGVLFDEDLASSGGSDKLFFWQLHLKTGKPIVWAANARVFEPVPASRLDLKWFIRRNYRYGASGVVIHVKALGRVRGHLVSFAKGGWLLARSGLLVMRTLRGRATLYDALADVCHGSGYFFGCLPAFRVKKYV